MLLCPKCKLSMGPSVRQCPGCGWSVDEVDGFLAYAPEYALCGGGFDASYFGDLAKLEAANFWFQARNKLILWALSRYHPDFNSFFEIGCGTGFVLAGIAGRFPHAQLTGSEIFVEGLHFASERVPKAQLMQMDARVIPFADEFDIVGAFDVLEHIEEDEAVLQQMRQAMKPSGTLLVSVPQHPWLWSPLDEFAHHCRRYTAEELSTKVHNAGFEILRQTSFVSLLLPAMLVSRIFSRRKSLADVSVRGELDLPAPVNWTFGKVLTLERMFIRAAMNFPAGGSRFIVARKR